MACKQYEWMTWPGRILRIGLLFFVLVMTATYTANLAAFFTQPTYQIIGPQDMDSLGSTTVLVLDNLEAQSVKGFVKDATPIFNIGMQQYYTIHYHTLPYRTCSSSISACASSMDVVTTPTNRFTKMNCIQPPYRAPKQHRRG